MSITNKRINRFINYAIFVIAFFLQSFGDGYFIAHNQDPSWLKAAKYGFVFLGIVWGMLQLRERRHSVFLREALRILLVMYTFSLVSLVLIFLRGGNLGHCLELIMRYSFSVLYAYVILNLFVFDDIYKLMTYVLFVSLMGWILEKGSAVLVWANYRSMSFADSYSLFESHYFSGPAIISCAFFLYYRRNKILSVLSVIFVILTFKRPSIIFAILFYILPLIVDPNYQVSKRTHRIFCIAVIIVTILYYYLLLSDNEWILERITGQTAHQFTSGRSTVLRNLLYVGFKSRGIGSSDLVVGKSIEMDLVAFLIEMSVAGLTVFVFSYCSISGRKIYAVSVMAFKMLSALTGSGFYNMFSNIPAYVLFGCINYLQEEPWEETRIKWKKLRFR